MTERTGHVCSLCKKAGTVKHIYFTKSSARRHEESCFNNINSRACATCDMWQGDGAYWFTCSHAHDMATGESRPTRDCEFWKIRTEEPEEEASWS